MAAVKLKKDGVSGSLKDIHSISKTEMFEQENSEIYEQKAKIPDYIGQTLMSTLVFIMGASMRGNFEKLFPKRFRY